MGQRGKDQAKRSRAATGKRLQCMRGNAAEQGARSGTLKLSAKEMCCGLQTDPPELSEAERIRGPPQRSQYVDRKVVPMSGKRGDQRTICVFVAAELTRGYVDIATKQRWRSIVEW